MTWCDLVPHGKAWRCVRCRRVLAVRSAKAKHRCHVVSTVKTGQELKRLLRLFGICPTAACLCDQRAQVMDLQGPDWCEENIAVIVGWMMEEVQQNGLHLCGGRLLRSVDAIANWASRRASKTRLGRRSSDAGARTLVRLAIRRARKKERLLAREV